jgi:hypothetical protein
MDNLLKAHSYAAIRPRCTLPIGIVSVGERAGSEMSTLRTHFAYRIDRWDITGESVMEHVAGVEDLIVARAAYEAACQRWPGEMITLRQGGRVIEDSSKTRLA